MKTVLSFAQTDAGAASTALGPLESRVMEVVWRRPNCNVRDVIARLPEPLAYTTVMTTLDRLYKKGLLTRLKSERAFVYAPRLSRPQWARRRAGEFMASFLAGPRPARTQMISCLLEAVEAYDAALLDDLSRQIENKKKERES